MFWESKPGGSHPITMPAALSDTPVDMQLKILGLFQINNSSKINGYFTGFSLNF
jgi:hypothetical protein